MLFHDEFFCHVVRGDGGRLVAVAPLMRTSVPGIGPPVLRMVQFFGADAALTEIRGVICRPEDQVAVVEALVEHFLARRGEWDVFRWAGLRHPVDAYSGPPPALHLRGQARPAGLCRRAAWKLGGSAPAGLLQHAQEPAQGLRVSRTRRLCVHVARDRAAGRRRGGDGAIPRAARGAGGSGRHDFPSRQIRAAARARLLLRTICTALAERGELRIFELEIGGAVVASRIAFLLGSDLYMYFAGYDPAWKTYSVMTVLMTEMFKWAFAHGVERINLSTGRDQSKMRWKPREVLFRNAVQVSPTMRARTAFGAFRAYEALSRARVKAAVAGRVRDGHGILGIEATWP